jgi:hypothetical protein
MENWNCCRILSFCLHSASICSSSRIL